MMGFGLSVAPRQYLGLECIVCKQLMDGERRDATMVEAALVGAARYAVCCGCGMEVLGPPWNEKYKARWDRRFNRNRRKAEKARPDRWFVFSMDDYVGGFADFKTASFTAKCKCDTNRHLRRLNAGFYSITSTSNPERANTLYIATARAAEVQGFDLKLMQKHAEESDG